MDLIRITDNFVTLDNEFYDNVTLQHGHTYLLRKAHGQRIVNMGLGQRIDGFDQLPHLSIEMIRPHSQPVKVLFLFEGGLGDAISLAVLLDALKTKYNIRSDVACKYEVWMDILKPLGFLGTRVQLPVELKVINEYDYIQISGDRFIQNKTGMPNRCVVEELGRAYGIDLSGHSVQYLIPGGNGKAALPETQKIRIGVNFDSKGLTRSYPRELQSMLISYFIEAGFEIFLFGLDRPILPGIGEDGPVRDYCGRTTVPELAALIRQMDVMVCVDSFIAHLSNILGINTIALLSVTRRGVFGWHKNVRCLESQIECTPCGEIANECPRGYVQCRAFFHESIHPEVITYSVIRECTEYFNRLIKSPFNRVPQ